MRQKRTAQVKAHIPDELKRQLELFVQESNVISMSDYLFEVLEEHVALRSIRTSKQRFGRRVGNS
jgi:hypothetical protein